MSLVNKLQERYNWTPNYQLVYKKPVPKDSKTIKVPQTTGIPGWIIFTYDNAVPVCLWVSKRDFKILPCIIDERLCGDTFLRVEKISELEFIVSDIWMYNSNCIFACSTFKQRYDWLKSVLDTFTWCVEGVTIDLIHKDDMNEIPIRGYEEHLMEEIGKHGYFVENLPGTKLLTIKKMALPDCYETSEKGFLLVPTLNVSKYLLSKGDTFQCLCRKHDDEFWEVVENIPEVK